MHELSLAEAMLDIIKEQAEHEHFTRVTGVILELGMLSHVEADAMTFCFEAVTADTLADGAILKIERIPAQGSCPQCKQLSPIENLYDPCVHCGEFGLALLSGDQLRIRQLEVI